MPPKNNESVYWAKFRITYYFQGMENNKHNMKDFLQKEVRTLYYLVCAFFLGGYALDIIFRFNSLTKHVLFTDTFVLTVVIVSLLLKLRKVISIQTSYLIIVYTSALGLVIAYFYSLHLGVFNSAAIFQDLITIPPIIFATGFIVNKRHMLLLGTLYFLSYPLLMFLSKDPMLVNSATFIAIMIIGATIAMLIFIGFMESSLKANAEANLKILKQKQDLEKLNDEKTKLFSVIAHDLRSPMGNAVSVASLLLEDDLNESDKEELIKTIYGMSKKAFNLLENLLSWAKIEGDKFNVHIEEIRLRQEAQKAADIFSINLKDKRIKLTNKISKEVKILSDKMILDTAFRNLISNAIKFTGEGGEIILDAEESNSTVTFSVRDTGVGIPKDKIQTLFDDKETVEPAYGTRNEKGVGLGIKLTKSLIEEANGTIRVESKEGKGTTFFVTFPKAV